MSPERGKKKMPPDLVVCPKCDENKFRATLLMTTHDGRLCGACGYAALTCHWCWKVVCGWEQGPLNSELQYMPTVCPNCGIILRCRD